jgi:hypothetical protein
MQEIKGTQTKRRRKRKLAKKAGINPWVTPKAKGGINYPPLH